MKEVSQCDLVQLWYKRWLVCKRTMSSLLNTWVNVYLCNHCMKKTQKYDINDWNLFPYCIKIQWNLPWIWLRSNMCIGCWKGIGSIVQPGGILRNWGKLTMKMVTTTTRKLNAIRSSGFVCIHDKTRIDHVMHLQWIIHAVDWCTLDSWRSKL